MTTNCDFLLASDKQRQWKSWEEVAGPSHNKPFLRLRWFTSRPVDGWVQECGWAGGCCSLAQLWLDRDLHATECEQVHRWVLWPIMNPTGWGISNGMKARVAQVTEYKIPRISYSTVGIIEKTWWEWEQIATLPASFPTDFMECCNCYAWQSITKHLNRDHRIAAPATTSRTGL